jgi:hypothetical protein
MIKNPQKISTNQTPPKKNTIETLNPQIPKKGQTNSIITLDPNQKDQSFIKPKQLPCSNWTRSQDPNETHLMNLDCWYRNLHKSRECHRSQNRIPLNPSSPDPMTQMPFWEVENWNYRDWSEREMGFQRLFGERNVGIFEEDNTEKIQLGLRDWNYGRNYLYIFF